jgi:hypothetical protein
MARMRGLEVPGFPEHLLTVCLLHLPEVGHLLETPECAVEASSSHRSVLTQGVQDVSEPMH